MWLLNAYCQDAVTHGSTTRSAKTMGQAFEALAQSGVIDADLAARMRKSVGFRNVMVHNYDDMNWAIVYAICTKHLGDFRTFAKVFSGLMAKGKT